jgi:hypothetical protein
LAKAVTRQVVAGLAMWPVSRVERLPLPWTSLSRVDTCPQSRGPNQLKTWLAGRPLEPFGLGFGPLGPHVKYNSVVMMILTFGQLHFIIP